MSIGVGLIGPGRREGGYGIGRFVAREILNYPLAELAALMATTPETVKEAIDSLNHREDIITKFKGTTYAIEQKNSFFNDPRIDLVIICSPRETHEQYIKQALINGKHVLSEKPLLYFPGIPLGKRIQNARDLLNLADSKNLLLATNCQRVAVIPVLCKEFSLPIRPSYIDIEFKVGSKSGRIESFEHLFESGIAHPLSLLVKYGVTNFELMNTYSCSKSLHYDESSLVISGDYKDKRRRLRYRIKLMQLKELPFASMKIALDNKSPVEITAGEASRGKIKTKYVKNGKGADIRYSEDNLKTSVTRMIDAVYYKDKIHQPLISNFETCLIYALQETMKENIIARYGKIFFNN